MVAPEDAGRSLPANFIRKRVKLICLGMVLGDHHSLHLFIRDDSTIFMYRSQYTNFLLKIVFHIWESFRQPVSDSLK